MTVDSDAARKMWQRFTADYPKQAQQFSPSESQVWARLLVALEEGGTDTVKL